MAQPPVALNGKPMRRRHNEYEEHVCFYPDGTIFCYCPGATRREARVFVAKKNTNGNKGCKFWTCTNQPYACDFFLWDDEKIAYGWNGLATPPPSPVRGDGPAAKRGPAQSQHESDTDSDVEVISGPSTPTNSKMRKRSKTAATHGNEGDESASAQLANQVKALQKRMNALEQANRDLKTKLVKAKAALES